MVPADRVLRNGRTYPCPAENHRNLRLCNPHVGAGDRPCMGHVGFHHGTIAAVHLRLRSEMDMQPCRSGTAPQL